MTGNDGSEMGNDMQQRSLAESGDVAVHGWHLKPLWPGAAQGQNSFLLMLK